MSAANDRHGGKVREAAERLGVPPEEILDFSANINFSGPTPPVVAAARRAIDQIAWYPEECPPALRRAAADFLDVPEGRVILGNGASELIFLAVADLRPERVLIIGPTFTEYERASLAWDAEVDALLLGEETGFELTLDLVESTGFKERLAAADLVFLCDPNNPTGHLTPPAVKRRLLESASEAGAVTLVDESFLAFTEAWPGGSATNLAAVDVLVLHSFTKLLAIPGLRVGALVADEERAPRLQRRIPPWNLNCAAVEAALAGLSQAGLASETAEATAEARAQLTDDLERVTGVERVFPGAANYVCLRLDAPQADRVAEATAERGVLVRDLSSFPGMGPHYLRAAVRSPEENRVLVEALAGALTESGIPARARS